MERSSGVYINTVTEKGEEQVFIQNSGQRLQVDTYTIDSNCCIFPTGGEEEETEKAKCVCNCSSSALIQNFRFCPVIDQHKKLIYIIRYLFHL